MFEPHHEVSTRCPVVLQLETNAYLAGTELSRRSALLGFRAACLRKLCAEDTVDDSHAPRLQLR